MLTNEMRRAEWEKLIEEQKASGVSKAEFCKRKGIKVARFYYYEGESSRKNINDKSSFVPVTIKNTVLAEEKTKKTCPLVRLILKNGIECVVPEEINKIYLKGLIEVLQQC